MIINSSNYNQKNAAHLFTKLKTVSKMQIVLLQQGMPQTKPLHVAKQDEEIKAVPAMSTQYWGKQERLEIIRNRPLSRIGQLL